MQTRSHDCAHDGFDHDQYETRVAGSRFGFMLLLIFALLLGIAFPAHAAQTPCSALPNATLDGDVTPVPPANIKIDANCRIQNYPGGINTNFSFDNNDPTPYLVIFDNVYLTGNMSCNVVAGHKIWFTNNSSTTLSASCQSILIPVEKIDKQNPVGQTTATIGVPFTYTMTIPILFDPATGNSFIDGSVNDLGNIHITDDLSPAATGADLELQSVIAYEEGTNTPVPINNIGGNNLDFVLPDIAASDQIIVEVTVVLRDNPVINVAGTTFFNTAKWSFSRFIDGQFFEPLPGESGITLPMTIAEPDLVVTKTSNETVLNLGVQATFTIDVQNSGGSDAWNATIFDQLPDGANAGMCDYDPTSGAGISAQIFEADGVTPVSAVLTQGFDFSASYRDASTNPPQRRCQLSLTMLTPATVIGPSQRLIITYQSQLDADTTGDGLTLTNIAGATEWFGADASSSPRTYTRTISDGTPTVVDHEDSYTMTTGLSGYVFHKTVENRTTGANPAATAAPGDTLRYRLRLFNVDQVFTGIAISDLLDVNSFNLNSFSMVTIPGNITFNYDDITGQLDILGNPPPLNLAIGGEIVIEFDITLLSSPSLSNGDPVLNQATLTADGPFSALSDDPAGGIVIPPAPGEPTLVLIQAPGPLAKANPVKTTATIGEQFTYTITVPAVPVLVPLYDVRILDDLGVSSADMSFVSANVVSGGSWALSNTSGSATDLIIEDTSTGIDIPSGGQAVIEITVEVQNTGTNNSDDPFNNSASFTYNRTNGIIGSQTLGGGATTADMTLVEPDLNTVSKVGTLISAAPVSGGSIIEYVISMTNGGTSTAYDVNVVDNLPAELQLSASFTPTASINGTAVPGFDPVPLAGPSAGQLIWGRINGDLTLDIPIAGTLILTYRAQVQTSTTATFNNVAWIDWRSLDNGSPSLRTGDGCPSITAPDDYCATVASAPFTITDSNSLNKTVIADSWITDGSTAIDKTVRIGDTVTYQLTLNLSEGSHNSVTVSDVLPPGMAFDSLVSITPASAAGDFTYALASQPGAGDAGMLVWDFGTVTNTPSNDGTPVDTLVIEYVASVLPDAGITQTPSATLTNTATLSYVDGAGTPVVDPGRLESTDSITLWQPLMAGVIKRESGATNTVANPLNVNVAVDTMQFQLESCNTTGLAPAYSVLLSDVLATQFDEASITAPVVTVNGFVLAGTEYIYTPPAARGDTVQIELLTAVNPGECVIVDYAIGFYTDFPPTQTWNNSVTVDEYWSLPQNLLPGSGQLYSALGPAQFFMTNVAGVAPLSKNVASPVSGEITIGEEAVYTITVPVNPFNAALNNVVVTDPLHAALTYMSATAVDGAGNLVALVDNTVGQNVSLAVVGQILATEQVIITLRTRLANNVAANAGVSFTNTATYTSTDLPDPISATSAALTIVEPSVTIAKTVVNTSNPGIAPNPGDILTYSLAFTASSGAIFTDAFDLSIIDTLSAGLNYVSGTARVDAVLINDPTGGPGPVLTWDLANADIDVVEGTTVTLTYDVLVGVGVLPGQALSNSASTQWTSLDGALGDPAEPNERDGSDGIGGLNDYVTGLVTTTLTTQSGALQKAVFPARTEAYVGEQFTYRVTVPALSQPTALNDVRILDNLNISTADTVDMSFVNVTKVSGTGSWLPGNTSGDLKNLIIEDTTGVGIDIPAGEQAIVDITVVLNDTAINTSGKVFNNTATYTYNVTQDPGQSDTSGDVIIIGPDTVTLEKTGPATMRVGAPETFTLNVQNASLVPGAGPAWDLTITDILPNTTTVPGPGGMCDTAPANITAEIFLADGTTSVAALVEGTDYSTSFIGCTLTVTMQSAIAAIDPGNRLIVTYDAVLDPDSIGGTSMVNVAAATQWFSGDTAGAGATGEIREYTGPLTDGTPGIDDNQDDHPVNVESPVLLFQKSVVNATTGIGADAQPGETLRYTLYVENTSVGIPLSSFSLLDELDALNVSAMFVPGSLNIVSALPIGAVDNTDPNGGVNGTGFLDVSNLSLAAADGVPGGADTIEVVFEATLVSAINSGTVVLNQAQIDSFGVVITFSDEPPGVAGDIDTTKTVITSAPAFVVQKTSLDITGDPAVLEAGDRLRYTITVKNVGNENTVITLLSDQIPSNTTYVVGSTTLNGLSVADVAGTSELTSGLLINAPEIVLDGFMRADDDVTADNVATITFEVDVNATVVGGTVISNQGFVTGNGAGSGTFPQRPSDDPTTAAVDDPTIDVVGNVPFFDVQKTVALVGDGNLNGIVDPGDELRYTITATNFGAVPITNAVFTDPVPADTQYVINSTTLNGSAVNDLPGNISPASGGIDISSSDLTPPLPTAGAGMLVPGQSAIIEFNVVVDAAAIPGTTVITNQGSVSSNELPDEPTDADGIDSNGDQPTVVTVGMAPLISITKQVVVIGGGAALAGGELEYIVRITNTGAVPVSDVVITDIVDPDVMTYNGISGLLNGLVTGVSFDDITDPANPALTADYSAIYGALPVAGVAELRFRVTLDTAPSLNIGDTVSNTAEVSWNVPAVTASASVDIGIGGTPGTISLNGQIWHDTDFDNSVGGGEALLQDWRVELYSNNVLLANSLTNVNGDFQFSGLTQRIELVDEPYEIRFFSPGATATTATLGQSHSAFTNTRPFPVDGPQRIRNIFAASGTSVLSLNLPRQPNGIVYDSVLRSPVAGVRLTMVNQTQSNQPVPVDCFDDPIHANQVTQAEGYYKFDLNFSDPGCARGDEYEIQVQPPADDFTGTTSLIIPPVEPVTGVALNVPNCPGNPALDKIPATTEHCENSGSDVPAPATVAPRTAATDYHLKFLFDDVAGTPFTDQIYNNHIPVDGVLEEAVAISKVAGKLNVVRSDLVPYTITFTNTLGVPLFDVSIIDNFPAGFKYVTGSARVDGEEIEPEIDGRYLTWPGLSVGINESRVIKLLLIVGSGVGEGEYVNSAWAVNTLTGGELSGVATATVRVIPDPTFDCTDIIGKVFDDKNLNAYQDDGERGLPGVQVATARGLRVTTDSHGRFHITCAIVANEVRGSNFIMKLDDRTLPSGYRVTTENPRVQRATRGKMLKFNFGTAIHRVVRLDLADGVFEKGSTELRPQWRSRIDLLINELQKEGSILRLSYLAENETEDEVDDRLDAIEDLVSDRWDDLDCCYKLTIETEVFWRKGSPSAGREFAE